MLAMLKNTMMNTMENIMENMPHLLVKASGRLPVPVARQAEGPPSFDDVAGAPESDGKRCIDKVEMVEQIEYDEVVQCDHSYDKRCHTTYVTNYESQQEEECDENFRKSCFIEYEAKAITETVQVCRTPLVKDCNVEGPEVCRTEYESECWTKQEEHAVRYFCHRRLRSWLLMSLTNRSRMT